MVEQAHAAKPPKDSFREILDTVVTVVVVVLLLRTYVAEAFIIPTGSMATTLYGYHKDVACPECGQPFPLNCSSERDAQPPIPVTHGVCPNCLDEIELSGTVNDMSRGLFLLALALILLIVAGVIFMVSGRAPVLPFLLVGAVFALGYGLLSLSMVVPKFPCVSGDRVLVTKYLYDWAPPERLDVVVFKNPEKPQVHYDPMNYIKRLVGLPGETIAIHGGNLYVNSTLQYPDELRPSDPKDLWRLQYTYSTFDESKEARELFQKGKFQIVQKPPAKLLAMIRPVYDNDHQAADLAKVGFPPRWAAESEPTGDAAALDFRKLREEAAATKAWAGDGPHAFRHPSREGPIAWLCYRHLMVPRARAQPLGELGSALKPQLITDFVGYNTSKSPQLPTPHWVGDLLLECEVKVDKAAGQLVLALAQGNDDFQARWDLTSGDCSLVRVAGGKEEVLATKPTAVKSAGNYRLRFANADNRLTVWVGDRLIFGDGIDFSEAKVPGPTADDLRPARIGVQGGDVQVSLLKLYRDTYYTVMRNSGESDYRGVVDDWSDPTQWGPLRDLNVLTFYVQPGHYFCMGDNSPESSDSRFWGLVPQRLLLGRALLVYWPVDRAGPIR